ncbi:MAG: hypothetical protein JWL81_2872 [Verrucomicrobiales bacterium]|nr:hypothetical protein [Verrucomicrobiales bacterium]
MHRFRLHLLLLLAFLPVLPSCETTGGGGPAAAARNQAILAEPRGDFWIGRRYFVDKVRFWGYVRRPGQLWENSQLVVMDESRVKTPDRLPEMPLDGGLAHGFDHNYEYRLTGNFTGRKVYDPNADMELPVFAPASYEVQNRTPGFLFSPTDRYSPKYIPAREVPRTTPARM